MSFVVRPRQTMGLASPAAASPSPLTIMGLLDPKATVTGEVLYDGQNLLDMNQKQMNALRGRETRSTRTRCPRSTRPCSSRRR